jgi:PAS domain S-box-containing protein
MPAERPATTATAMSVWHNVRGSTPAAIGLALTLATVLALVLLGVFAYSEMERAERTRLSVLAQVADDGMVRSVGSLDKTLVALTSALPEHHDAPAVAAGNRALSFAAAAHSAVVAIQWLDASGAVLASSAPGFSGARFAMQQLGALPPVGQHKAGALVSAAAWTGVTPQTVSTSLGAPQFIGLVRAVKMDAERVGYLLALLNPHELLPRDGPLFSASRAALHLFTESADLLASLPAATGLPAPGDKATNHPVFTRFAPTVRMASFSDTAGSSAARQWVSFRRVPDFGLVVVAEQPLDHSWQAWYVVMQRYFVGSMVALLAIALACLPAHRAHRRLNRARARLLRARAKAFRDGQERIFRTDKRGMTTAVTRAWRTAFSPVLDVPVGTALADLADPDYRAQVQALFEAQSPKKVRTALAKMGIMDGQTRHFNLVVIPWKDSDGVDGFLGSAVDMSERFEAETAVQRQLAFVALILEMSPWPVATFDAKGRYLSVNHAWEDFVGLSREQVLGTVSASFMSSEDFLLHKAHDAELARLGGRVRYEAKVPHRDGSRRDVIVNKVLLPTDDGQAPGWLSALLDVSEFRHAERVTQEAIVEAEEASRAKSEFTANVSHELRTPLQSILGFSELGAMRAQRTPQLQQMFEQIHVSGGRMLALVNNLLDLSKIESAVGPMSLTRADLRELIPPIVDELRPLLDAKDLDIQVGLSRDNLIAKIDPDRFQQVIRNVLANAIKFSPMDGHIEIAAQVHGERDIAITVRDHGAGIPPTELDAIFGAFVQSTRTKDGSGGTGLGLAICRKIIDFHGGRIQAANCPDGGAVFTIVLPRRHYLNRDSGFETGYGSIF